MTIQMILIQKQLINASLIRTIELKFNIYGNQKHCIVVNFIDKTSQPFVFDSEDEASNCLLRLASEMK
jgi:hypothetical protein